METIPDMKKKPFVPRKVQKTIAKNMVGYTRKKVSYYHSMINEYLDISLQCQTPYNPIKEYAHVDGMCPILTNGRLYSAMCT